MAVSPQPLPYDTRSVMLGGARMKSRSGLIISIAAHITLFVGAWWYVQHARTPKEQPKVVTAKLVQLGKPRDEKLLPRLPMESAAPPAVESGKTVSIADPNAAKASEAIERQKKLMDALAKLKTEGPTGKKAEEKVGREDGSIDGDAEQAEEGDRYGALVMKALKDHFIVPTTISPQERLYLFCELNLFIAPDGKLMRFTLEKSSGNAQFDRAVEATIQRAELPPPPDSLRDAYADAGLPVRFKP